MPHHTPKTPKKTVLLKNRHPWRFLSLPVYAEVTPHTGCQSRNAALPFTTALRGG
jgi:hypothetical protein